MRRSVAVAALLLLLLTACFADFLVGPGPNVQPSLIVFVSAQQAERLDYYVSADFLPGTDANGHARRMTDSSMVVADSAIAGGRTFDGRFLFYGWADTNSSVRDTIPVRGPSLEQQSSVTPTILVPTPLRTDPWFADHVVGDDVRLNFSGYGDAPFGFGSDVGQWRLEVWDARDDRPLLNSSSFSRPSSPIVIPWQWLPAVAGDSLTVRLHLSSTFTSLLTPYRTFLNVSGFLTWQMRVVAPSP